MLVTLHKLVFATTNNALIIFRTRKVDSVIHLPRACFYFPGSKEG